LPWVEVLAGSKIQLNQAKDQCESGKSHLCEVKPKKRERSVFLETKDKTSK
jgi:hypothetical protein